MSIDAKLAAIHAQPWDRIPAGLDALAREQAAKLDAVLSVLRREPVSYGAMSEIRAIVDG